MTKGLLKTMKCISRNTSSELTKEVNNLDIAKEQIVDIVCKGDLLHLFYYS